MSSDVSKSLVPSSARVEQSKKSAKRSKQVEIHKSFVPVAEGQRSMASQLGNLGGGAWCLFVGVMP